MITRAEQLHESGADESGADESGACEQERASGPMWGHGAGVAGRTTLLPQLAFARGSQSHAGLAIARGTRSHAARDRTRLAIAHDSQFCAARHRAPPPEPANNLVMTISVGMLS